MPQLDNGPTDGPPGQSLKTVWATLSKREAVELLESLESWKGEIDDGFPDPGWHTHVTDSDGNELTVAVSLDGEPSEARQLDQPG